MTRIVVAIVIAFAWLDGYAQSSLPPCPTDTSVVWTDCFGTYNFPDFGSYTGEFENDQYHGTGSFVFEGFKYVGSFRQGRRFGQGSLISAKGYTIVEGRWLDDVTVDVNGTRWVHTASSVDGLTHWFISSESIKQEGALRRAWTTVSYPAPRDNKTLSQKVLYKFDCSDERTILLTATSYSGAFGFGNALSQSDEGKWNYVSPNSVMSIVMKYVCDYKL